MLASESSAFVLSFDFDAEEVWIGENPENAAKPGVLSQGAYGAKVGIELILRLLADRGVQKTFLDQVAAGDRARGVESPCASCLASEE